ncbi:hypothetical protein [Streptomyces olivaceus]|uniref:hypothetical protein n=1 Tax=Streptomyces olivaceus TaxID=47716 RepID=UPI00339F3F4B
MRGAAAVVGVGQRAGGALAAGVLVAEAGVQVAVVDAAAGVAVLGEVPLHQQLALGECVHAPFERAVLGEVGGERACRDRGVEGDADALDRSYEEGRILLEDPVQRLVR